MTFLMAGTLVAVMERGMIMNTTILNYPGFQDLPKGARQMLLVSEAHFFDQPVSHPREQRMAVQVSRTNRFQRLFEKHHWQIRRSSFALLLRPAGSAL